MLMVTLVGYHKGGKQISCKTNLTTEVLLTLKQTLAFSDASRSYSVLKNIR